MSRCLAYIALGFTGAVSVALAQDHAERQLNVQQGPDSVFAREPAQIFSELLDARPTQVNGRVGNELVFWGFELADGRQVFLSACAERGNVDCEARLNRVCPAGADILRRATEPGQVREVNCSFVRRVNPGDLHPGCTDRENPRDLVVSLIACH